MYRLTVAQLEQLRAAVIHYYQYGELPEGIPEWLHNFVDGDMGYLNLIDMAIVMKKELES